MSLESKQGLRAVAAMPVAERFVSVNGEGLHVGQFSTFVRFVGCNLACSYCDTKWACEADCPSEQMTPQEILAFVQEQATPCVTLTGGEPTLQPLLPELLRCLVDGTDCFVELETNGAVNLSSLAALRSELYAQGKKGRIGFTLDCKSPSSGMDGRMIASNYELLGPDDCVKFVVGSEEDLKAARAVIEDWELVDRCSVLLSPVAGEIDPARIVAYLQERGLLKARVQLQLHKIIWPKQDRGV